MLSASFWCLLQPALSTAEESGIYGHRFAIVPVLLGFLVGCLFMEISDRIVNGDVVQFFRERTAEPSDRSSSTSDDLLSINSDVRRRKGISKSKSDSSRAANSEESTDVHWRRMILLIIAVVVHNIPEGFAVGTAFAASGNKDTSFEAARSLAFAIAMQNFPEGFVVSMPLKMAGASSTAAFFWGQLSGMVEPIAAVVGVLVNEISQVLTPYSMCKYSFFWSRRRYIIILLYFFSSFCCGRDGLCCYRRRLTRRSLLVSSMRNPH